MAPTDHGPGNPRDPFPQYETEEESEAGGGDTVADHLLEEDPHTQYETGAEVVDRFSVHEATADAHAAENVTFTPAGTIAATDVQAAIEEAAAETAHPNLATHDALGLATDAELSTHAGLADPHTGYLLESLLDAKGDLIVASAADTPGRLAVGSNYQYPVADSAATFGLRYKDQPFFDPKDYGAPVNGTDSDVAGIQAAADAAIGSGSAGKNGVLYFAPGKTYVLDSGITIKCAVWGVGARIIWTGGDTGTAITLIGTSGEDYRYYYRTAFLPTLDRAAVNVLGPAGADIGVEIVNAQYSHIFQTHVKNFSTGWKLTTHAGTSAGNQYNEYHLPNFEACSISLDLSPADANGWVNDNSFHGGQCGGNDDFDGDGTRGIFLRSASNPVNNNRFYGTSLESTMSTDYRIECYGRNNVWDGCRFEGGTPRVYYRGAFCSQNKIRGGFEAELIVFNEEATSFWNSRETGTHTRIHGQGAGSGNPGGALIVGSYSLNTSPAITILPGTTLNKWSLDPTVDWMLRASAQKIEGKAQADTTTRLELDASVPHLKFGPGSAAALDWTLARTGSAIATITGSLVLTGGLYLASGQGINNSSTVNNAQMRVDNNGPYIRRNIADANPSLIVSQDHASSTGDIAQFKNSTGTVAKVSQAGQLTQNGSKTVLDTDHTAAADPHTGYRLESATIGTSDITDAAVTYAKVQDVSATNRFLGRISSGSGDTEELTAANAKTILALAASDLPAHGATEHTDITRSLWLPAPLQAESDSGTGNTSGTFPDAMRLLTLADGATQGSPWKFLVPSDWASGALTCYIYWFPVATDATPHTVRWSWNYKELAAGGDVTAAGTTTTQTGSSAARTAQLLVIETAQAILTPSAVNTLIRLDLQRIGADAADTYVGNVRVAGLRVDYTATQ